MTFDLITNSNNYIPRFKFSISFNNKNYGRLVDWWVSQNISSNVQIYFCKYLKKYIDIFSPTLQIIVLALLKYIIFVIICNIFYDIIMIIMIIYYYFNFFRKHLPDTRVYSGSSVITWRCCFSFIVVSFLISGGLVLAFFIYNMHNQIYELKRKLGTLFYDIKFYYPYSFM